MDPFSQGTLGVVGAQNVTTRSQRLAATLLGLCAGMAPDLDVFIRSSEDPLLFLEYHRQFTHSLIFIPVGGLLCALLLHWLVRRWGLVFRQTLLYCTAGYATHAFLDASTSYGTQLLWPFSTLRVAWSNISIIDPLFTAPLVLLVILFAWRGRALFARMALVWAMAYLTFGVVQRERAESVGQELAAARGHDPVTVEAKPGFGNLLVWKVIYETADHYHVDAVRTGFELTVYPGTSVPKLDIARDFPWLDPDSQQARDIERFSWFSEGWVSAHPGLPDRVIDVRYSMLPNEIRPLWMIELDRDAAAGQHVGYVVDRQTEEHTLAAYRHMLAGTGEFVQVSRKPLEKGSRSSIKISL